MGGVGAPGLFVGRRGPRSRLLRPAVSAAWPGPPAGARVPVRAPAWGPGGRHSAPEPEGRKGHVHLPLNGRILGSLLRDSSVAITTGDWKQVQRPQRSPRVRRGWEELAALGLAGGCGLRLPDTTLGWTHGGVTGPRPGLWTGLPPSWGGDTPGDPLSAQPGADASPCGTTSGRLFVFTVSLRALMRFRLFSGRPSFAPPSVSVSHPDGEGWPGHPVFRHQGGDTLVPCQRGGRPGCPLEETHVYRESACGDVEAEKRDGCRSRDRHRRVAPSSAIVPRPPLECVSPAMGRAPASVGLPVTALTASTPARRAQNDVGPVISQVATRKLTVPASDTLVSQLCLPGPASSAASSGHGVRAGLPSVTVTTSPSSSARHRPDLGKRQGVTGRTSPGGLAGSPARRQPCPSPGPKLCPLSSHTMLSAPPPPCPPLPPRKLGSAATVSAALFEIFERMTKGILPPLPRKLVRGSGWDQSSQAGFLRGGGGPEDGHHQRIDVSHVTMTSTDLASLDPSRERCRICHTPRVSTGCLAAGAAGLQDPPSGLERGHSSQAFRGEWAPQWL